MSLHEFARALLSSTSQKKEPIATVVGTYGGRFIVAPINPAMVLQTGMALYAECASTTSQSVDEHTDFEKWASNPCRSEKLPLDRWPTNGAYKDHRTYIAFYGWKAGRAALNGGKS